MPLEGKINLDAVGLEYQVIHIQLAHLETEDGLACLPTNRPVTPEGTAWTLYM